VRLLLKYITLPITVTSISSTAHAENWVFVGKADTGSITFYDSDSLKTNGRIVTIWEKVEARSDRTEPYSDAKFLMEYDCGDNTVYEKYEILYYRSGKTESNGPFEYGKWAPIAPGTIGASAIEALCPKGTN
jgi:hypothetical protein